MMRSLYVYFGMYALKTDLIEAEWRIYMRR